MPINRRDTKSKKNKKKKSKSRAIIYLILYNNIIIFYLNITNEIIKFYLTLISFQKSTFCHKINNETARKFAVKTRH